MSNVTIPGAYSALNNQLAKSPIIVVVIAGVPYIFTSRDLQTELVYGAPNITYGEDGIIYGGLISYGSYLSFIDLDNSSLVLQQRLEPEQGKASVSTLTIAFIDGNNYYMTQVCSPGIIIPDILLTQVDVFLGFAQTTFPTDFFKIFRGYVSGVADGPGSVSLQISDANLKARTNLFYITSSNLVYSMGTTDQYFTLQSNQGFFAQVPQPDGSAYNEAIRTYVLIDSEWIECIPIRQGNYQYQALIQGVIFTANLNHGTDVGLIYTSGGTAGSEVVTVSGSVITVQVQVGVSTAAQVIAAILQVEAASDLVLMTALTPATTQSAMGLTYLFSYVATIQGLFYTATTGNGLNVSITYIDGATAGSEVVTVSGGSITVQIQSGVSTALQIYTKVIASVAASALVTVVDVSPSVVNVIQGQTFLVPSNTYTFLVEEGIVYYGQPGTSGITLAYANTVLAGSETVSITGSAITVNIQSGVSTAQQVANALIAYSGIVNPLVSFELMPHSEGFLQTSFTTTNFIAGVPASQFAVIERGARGTTAATHDPDPVNGNAGSAGIQVGDPVFTENAMLMALKIYLSGWGTKWLEKVPVSTIGINPDPAGPTTQTQAIQMPVGIDLVELYNIVPGDICYLYGSDVKSNNGIPLTIVRFANSSTDNNNVIYVEQVLTKDNTSTSITVSFRSQYDSYPIEAGLHLTPPDIDIDQHIYVLETFLGAVGNYLVFFITSTEDSGKDFIQTEVYFPVGAYGLSRYGELSVGYNAPPIASQNITYLNSGNVLEPQNIRPSRAVNNRQFFNEITFQYGVDDSGNFTKEIDVASGPSVSLYGGYTNILPIASRGIIPSYPTSVIQKVANYLLLKYQYGATTFQVKVNWQAGSITEVGDIALLDDSDGILQIANFQTGKRGLGKQIFSIIDRTFNFKEGNVSLTLQNNVGSQAGDRFGTISPSSLVATGSTHTTIIIQDSFGAIFPRNESAKWSNYVGLTVLVHSPDYSVQVTVTLVSISASNNYLLNVSDMGFSPPAGYIVDVAQYPTSTNPSINALYKLVHDSLRLP